MASEQIEINLVFRPLARRLARAQIRGIDECYLISDIPIFHGGGTLFACAYIIYTVHRQVFNTAIVSLPSDPSFLRLFQPCLRC
jgi:hypothetical protein